jgi:hypothetical protein
MIIFISYLIKIPLAIGGTSTRSAYCWTLNAVLVNLIIIEPDGALTLFLTIIF